MRREVNERKRERGDEKMRKDETRMRDERCYGCDVYVHCCSLWQLPHMRPKDEKVCVFDAAHLEVTGRVALRCPVSACVDRSVTFRQIPKDQRYSREVQFQRKGFYTGVAKDAVFEFELGAHISTLTTASQLRLSSKKKTVLATLPASPPSLVSFSGPGPYCTTLGSRRSKVGPYVQTRVGEALEVVLSTSIVVRILRERTQATRTDMRSHTHYIRSSGAGARLSTCREHTRAPLKPPGEQAR